MEVLLLNNLHARIGRMDATNNRNIIKRGWQCKVGRERFTPYQSEDPRRFELFCLYQNAYNGQHKIFPEAVQRAAVVHRPCSSYTASSSCTHLFNLSIYSTVSERKIRSNYSYNVEMNEYANI